MITKIKRKDVKKLVGDEIYNHELYYALDQAADKIRAIYVLFGWSHMLKDIHETNDLVVYLVSECAKQLVEDSKRHSANCSSAGVKVELFVDETTETISIEIDFNILH